MLPEMADSRPVRSPEPALNDRRTLLRTAAGLVLAWLTPIRSDAQSPGPTVAPGDLLVRVGDASLIPITPDDVPFDGRALLVWPLSGDTRATTRAQQDRRRAAQSRGSLGSYARPRRG
jgi:hypothetical protein